MPRLKVYVAGRVVLEEDYSDRIKTELSVAIAKAVPELKRFGRVLVTAEHAGGPVHIIAS